MNSIYLKRVLIWLFSLAFVFFVSTGAVSKGVKRGMDGEVIKYGEEIISGIGIIGQISFTDHTLVIEDQGFELDENLDLIDKGEKFASQQIFVPGVRVVWKAKGGKTIISLDHYPLDEEADVATRDVEAPEPRQTTSGSGSKNVTQGKDGVYRN